MRTIYSLAIALGLISQDSIFQRSLLASKPAQEKTEGSKSAPISEESFWNESTSSLWSPTGPSRLDLAQKGPKAGSYGRTCLEVWLPISESDEKGLVQLMRNSLFPDPMESDDFQKWLGASKGCREERRSTERAEGDQTGSSQAVYGRVAREVTSLEGFYTSYKVPACLDGETSHSVSRRSASGTSKVQEQEQGRDTCRILEEGRGSGGRPTPAGRSHKKGTWRKYDRRDEASTGTHVQLAGKAKTQVNTLTSESNRKSSESHRDSEEEGGSTRCGLGTIQERSRNEGQHTTFELPGSKERSLRATGSESGGAQATTDRTQESCYYGNGDDLRRSGGRRWRNRSRFRGGHPDYPRFGRERHGAQTPEAPQEGRARDMMILGRNMDVFTFVLRRSMEDLAIRLELFLAIAPDFKAAFCRDGDVKEFPDFDNTTGSSSTVIETCAANSAAFSTILASKLDDIERSKEWEADLQSWHGMNLSKPVGPLVDYLDESTATKFVTIEGILGYEFDTFEGKCDYLSKNMDEYFDISSTNSSFVDFGWTFSTFLGNQDWYLGRWNETLWDDEWIAFFFGVMVAMIFLGLSLLLFEFCSELKEPWRLGKRRSNCEKKIAIVCRRRCRQRKHHPHQGRPKVNFLVRYLMFWHLWFPLAFGAAPAPPSLNASSLDEFRDEVCMMQRADGIQFGWEHQLREWLGIHQLRTNQTLVRVWQHQWRRRYVSDSVGQNIWVDKRINIEEQIRRQLLFMDEENPLRWSKVTPTPIDHAYRRTHVLATGIPYPFFLAVLAEVNNGERTWYQSVIIEHQQSVVGLREFFDLVWRNNQCADDYECYTLQPHRTDWPEQIDLFDGELISVFHLSRSRERTFLNDTSSRCTDVGSNASSSSSTDDEYTSLVSTNWAYKRSLSSGTEWASGRFPEHQRLQSDLGQRIEATRAEYDVWDADARNEAFTHTQVQGQDLITNCILGTAEQTDGLVRLHVHGLIAQEVRVERILLNTLLIRDFLDLLVVIRERWNDVRTNLDMNLHFVSEQPTDIMHGGERIITLLMDLSPRARQLPILIVTRLDQEGFTDSYDIREYKYESLIHCADIKRITGLSMLRLHNARCVCSLDHNVIQEDELVPISAGTMLMVHIYFDLRRCQEGIGNQRHAMLSDEVGLMQNPLSGGISNPDPFLMTWLYGYCHGLNDPIRAWRGKTGELSPATYLAQQLSRLLDTHLKEQILSFKVFPIPGDLVRRSTEAYVLIEEGNIKPWERLILLDTTWETDAGGLGGYTFEREEKLREAKIVDHQLSRDHFLRQVGLDIHCSRPQKICIITIRGRHWPEELKFATTLHGDLCSVTVRNRPISKAPTLTTEALESFCPGDDIKAKSRSQQSHPSIETQRHDISNTSQNDEPEDSRGKGKVNTATQGDKDNPHHDDSSLMQMYHFDYVNGTQPARVNNSCDIPGDRADYDFQTEEEARRRIIQQGEEEIRALIEETVEIFGEFNLLEEIRGLRGRRDLRIGLLTHGLAERHLGTKQVELEVGRAMDLQYICRRVTGAWLHDIQWQRMKILFVFPQPFEADPDGREWIHLLVDFRPNLEGTQLLVRVAFIFHNGEEGDLEAVRIHTPVAPDLIDRLGLMHICEQRDATCQLSVLRVHFYELAGRIPVSPGKYFMVDIYSREAMLEPDHDEVMMMTMGTTGRQVRYFFVYRIDDDEPTSIQRFDPDVVSIPGNTEAERLSYQYLRSGRSNGERSVTMHILRDQPENMFAFSALGYMAVDDSLERNAGALTLVDIGFYVAGSQRTVRGHVANEEWRETKLLPWFLDRSDLPKRLGLQNFCRELEDVCTFWHRGELWIDGTREMNHGDYIIAKVLQRNENLPLHLQWQLAQDCDQDLLETLRDQSTVVMLLVVMPPYQLMTLTRDAFLKGGWGLLKKMMEEMRMIQSPFWPWDGTQVGGLPRLHCMHKIDFHPLGMVLSLSRNGLRSMMKMGIIPAKTRAVRTLLLPVFVPRGQMTCLRTHSSKNVSNRQGLPNLLSALEGILWTFKALNPGQATRKVQQKGTFPYPSRSTLRRLLANRRLILHR